MGSNLDRMRVYVDQHGPEPAGRAYVSEYAHVFTMAVTAGRGNSPGTPVDTGEARGSWRFGFKAIFTLARKAAFHTILGAVEVDKVLRRWVPGKALVWWNVAFHAIILAGGRRPDRNGRMIGSIQAPDGWIEQSENEARAHMRGWHPAGKKKLSSTLAFERGGA